MKLKYRCCQLTLKVKISCYLIFFLNTDYSYSHFQSFFKIKLMKSIIVLTKNLFGKKLQLWIDFLNTDLELQDLDLQKEKR